MNVNIEAIKKQLDIPQFNQTDLLKTALTHPSYIYENYNLNRQQKDNAEREYRRLAILGDAIFGAAVVDYLHRYFPKLNQGTISQWKSYLVSRKQAYKFAKSLKLRQFCLLGGSEKWKNEIEQQDLLGEMFEALLGAIYIEFERDFYKFSHWLVKHFLANAFN